MFTKIKNRMGRNRYVMEVVFEAQDMKRGLYRYFWIMGGMIDRFIKHRGNLCDYKTEIENIKNNEYMLDFTYKEELFHFYLPNYEKDYIQGFIANYATFYERNEIEYLKRYIKPGDVVLDIGANIGNHTVYFSRICKAGKVYSFEPVKSTYDVLERNVQLNCKNDAVETYNVGLGHHTGCARVSFYSEDTIGSSTIEEAEDGDVSLKQLDDFVFNRIDFIKMDVEGVEYNVLLGAKETLIRHNPTMVMEISDLHYSKVNTLMHEYGYSQILKVSDGNYIYKKSGKY